MAEEQEVEAKENVAEELTEWNEVDISPSANTEKVEFEVEWFSHAICCFALQCNATMFMSSLILTWALQKYKDLIKVVYTASAAVVKLGETSFLPTFDRHDEWFSGYSLKSYWWSNLLGNFMIKLLIQ